jgi:hypothetical protein
MADKRYRRGTEDVMERVHRTADDDHDLAVHPIEQPGGTRAILEMYRARQTDAEQNRPNARRS